MMKEMIISKISRETMLVMIMMMIILVTNKINPYHHHNHNHHYHKDSRLMVKIMSKIVKDNSINKNISISIKKNKNSNTNNKMYHNNSNNHQDYHHNYSLTIVNKYIQGNIMISMMMITICYKERIK